VKEHSLALTQLPNGHGDDVSRSGEARVRVADGAAPLQSLSVEPIVHEGKVLAAVIDFRVIDPKELSVLHHHRVARPPISDAGHVLGEMDGRIRVVSYAEQEHLAIELVYPADGAVDPVRNLERM
jgi:hypothetical protein